MRLYDIDTQLEAALEAAFDPETGEILDEEAMARVDELQLERDNKIEGVALWIKNLTAEAEALKKEKEAFAAREKAAKNKVERLKGWLAYALHGEKFKTDRTAISWRKSVALEVNEDAIDMQRLGPEFIKLPPPELNKTAIKDAIKEGAIIPGCQLVERQNIQIK
ncbi:MAG: siphovirus Gp157 family protein [Oscillospiraceae bacterium]|nr:siphovirus Gp157 family protein [Oscillospiraceae bacterium]